MATLFYDFDEKSNTGDYEYVTDLSDWLDNLDDEEAFDVMYSMFTDYPKYFEQLDISKDEVESITKDDKDIIKDILSLFNEADLFADNKDSITDFYYDDARFEYESN